VKPSINGADTKIGRPVPRYPLDTLYFVNSMIVSVNVPASLLMAASVWLRDTLQVCCQFAGRNAAMRARCGYSVTREQAMVEFKAQWLEP
jgi:hypothetical protein